MSHPSMPATPGPPVSIGTYATSQRARKLTNWALAMIPGTGLSLLVASLVGIGLMHATGTPEGELLTSSGFAGWVSWAVVTVLMVSAPTAGTVLSLRARREGGAKRSNLAFWVNALLLAGFVIPAIISAIGSLIK
jgi:hypothetical protein